jgi:hypothetical protein
MAGVYLIDVHLVGVYLPGVYFMGVHFDGRASHGCDAFISRPYFTGMHYGSLSAKTPTASSRSSEIAPELARPRQTTGVTCMQLSTVTESSKIWGEGEIEIAKIFASCQTRTGGLGIALA